MAATLYPLFDLTDYQARIRSIGTLDCSKKPFGLVLLSGVDGVSMPGQSTAAISALKSLSPPMPTIAIIFSMRNLNEDIRML